MYHDLIRSELNEAADTLAKFINDDANIDAIHARRCCWRIPSKPAVK